MRLPEHPRTAQPEPERDRPRIRHKNGRTRPAHSAGRVHAKIRRRPTLPGRLRPSTIGAGGLNCRVRDGNGCDPTAMTTGNMSTEASLENSTASTNFLPQKRLKPSPRPISTGQLNTLPCLHFRPINVVVCHGPYPVNPGGRSHLRTGFPLRCFQRLSFPQVANQPCSWQNNWHTRAASVPVLSY